MLLLIYGKRAGLMPFPRGSCPLTRMYPRLLYTIILVVVPSVLLLYQVLTAESPKDYGRASTLTKVIMLFGIVSMWAFNLLSRI